MERSTVMKTLRDRDKDASFSSHLIPDKPIHHQTAGSTPTLCTSTRALEDTTSELSIFDAHKYFNEVSTTITAPTMNDNIQKVSISRVSPLDNNMERIPERSGEVITETTTTTTSRYSSASSSVDGYANIRNYRARSFHAATPTASSEASWNSQAGLLSHPPGAISVSMKNPQNTTRLNDKLRTSLSKPIWLLRRKCPCTGKKSVQVKEITTPEPKSETLPPPERDYCSLKRQENDEIKVHNHIITPNNWILDHQTAPAPASPTTFVKSQRFQNPNSQRVVSSMKLPLTDGFTFPVLNPNPTITKLKAPNGVLEDDPPRDSLEVFRPPDEVVEQKPPMNFHFPQKPRAVVVDDDAASDASSDLFEIESFSSATQSTYPAGYRRNSRDSFDESSAATTTAGFFFDRRSMDEGSTTPTITECYEPSEASIEWSVTTAEGHDETASVVTAEEKWKRKGGNGLLVSCRCEKAVSVGPQPVKCGMEEQRSATSSSHVIGNGGVRFVSVNKPPRHRNTPPRVSLGFAT
ncbi:hypothetical protein RJT34_21762 [Clitoria ternatea]|uniref:Protein PHYTOCHROME KINASE SUBSTRATE 4 n=1 Tax=Clitoria ternatea TaxID=43366 RepID=A0AAN9IUL5_CLITE